MQGQTDKTGVKKRETQRDRNGQETERDKPTESKSDVAGNPDLRPPDQTRVHTEKYSCFQNLSREEKLQSLQFLSDSLRLCLSAPDNSHM